jgi:hypothetical protein
MKVDSTHRHREERDFHIKEFELVKAEVFKVIDQAENLFRLTVALCLGYFSWILVNGTHVDESRFIIVIPKNVWLVAVFVPCAFVCISFLFGVSMYARIKCLGAYLSIIERNYGNAALGWEEFLKNNSIRLPRGRVLSWQVLIAGMSWALLFVGCTVFGYVLKSW